MSGPGFDPPPSMPFDPNEAPSVYRGLDPAAVAEEEARARRKNRWILGTGAVLIVIAMVLAAGGVWRALQPSPTKPPLSDLKLDTPEVPGGTDFGAQKPDWTDCGDGFSCADVNAPLDWAHPEGETIALRLVKHPATNGKPIGTLFVNPGGPGASGASFVRDSLDFAVGAALKESFDVVGWDPRGVGASSSVHCLDAAAMDEYLFGPSETEGYERGSEQWIAAAIDESRKFGAACAKNTGALLAHVDTMSTVHDLDMLREIVGDKQLNYLGYSYGTYIGARYADAYPDKVGRLVLDGVLDPATTEADVVREQTRGFELALRSYAASCLAQKNCPLHGSVDEAMSQIGALLDAVDEKPLTGSDGRELSASTLLTAIITPLYSQSNWGYLDRLFSSVANGDADFALALADSYYGRANGTYTDNSTEAFSAINCLDYPNSIDPVRMREEAAELEQVAPTIGRFQGYGDVGCAGWPYKGVDERSAVSAPGAAPILIVGTTGDPATPYRWAVSLSEQLESSVLVTYRGEGHTAYGNNDCVDRAVERYLISGTTPSAGLTCG